ncbi:MAG: hypothetical protein Q7S81_01655, partial [bacterium]|nr:hypothetical protein [bacterium]
SIEDVNYFILNQTETSGTMGLSDRIFKPLATGVIDLMAFNVGVSYNQNIPGTSSDVYIDLYEWNSATQNKGILLAKSGAITVYSHTSGLTLYFSGENSVVLDSSKYYYFEINTTSSGLSINWRPYIVIKAASTGIIGISSPASNYVYGDPNVDFSFKYLEPSSNKYNAVVVETRDFYTDVIVDNYRVDLETSQKTIGWHEISGNLGINRPGYFKIKASLSDSIKSEAYFSVFGAEPAEGKLLDQNSFSTGLSGSQFSGQVFRPVVSGQVDSLTLRVNSTGSDSSSQSDSYWNIYEWDGTGNDLNGSRGALLATTTPKFLVPRTYYPGPVEETWDFDSNNEIYLDSSKYYFLTLSIVSRNPQNPLTPQLSMNISTNGSLIDGRLIGQYINQGDLYLIINKKAENPSL